MWAMFCEPWSPDSLVACLVSLPSHPAVLNCLSLQLIRDCPQLDLRLRWSDINLS
jgi:hypothetical protein